ncbi:MAG: sulfotransferase [Pseudomonadales bacterium]|nr:sulfotransferase [Pseudomonadales bacterium]
MNRNTTLEKLNDAMSKQIEGDLAYAEEIYLDILRTEPDHPDAVHLLGLIRGEQDRNDEAVALIEKAIDINPDAAPFHHNIAGIYRRMGRLEDAEREFREAIRLKPDYGEAYQGLAEMIRFQPDDPLLPKILEQLSRPDLDQAVRCYFHFAAGKINDDIGQYRLAFRHYTQGNKDARKDFDSAAFRRQIKDAIYVYSREYVDSVAGTGHDSRQPVFVVGMPRSGTTLVEQILASHSGVYGAGELNDMKFVVQSASRSSNIRQPWPNCAPGIRPRQYRALGQEYLDRVAAVLPEEQFDRVVDKHPLNFQFVGLILSILPNAKIIHTVRHPLDTCLSCFFQNFTKGQHYSFDLVKLAHFFNDYKRLMEHWQTVFGDRILTVSYETLLDDLESETRRVLDFCDLEFEEACLNYHETRRVVKTASFMQVRQPIYKTSLNRWRNYAQELQPVAEILGLPIEQPVTISLGSRI